MKTNGKSTPRDIILAAAFGIRFRDAEPFFRTLAQTGYAGRVVVFSANLSRRERGLYARAGASLEHHGMHLHRVLRRPLQALFWRLVRRWPHSGSYCPPLDRLQQANVLRWSLCRRYLGGRLGEFDRALMVDLRDVCFQRDPFEGLGAETLRVHAEEGDVSVGDSSWNAGAMRRAFGTEGLHRWGRLRVSCSGAVSGGIAPALAYLEAFARLLPEVRVPDHGTDQAIHTRLVGEDLAPIVTWQSNREGDAIHLALVGDLGSVPRDPAGRLLDGSGEPYAILHQYDRHPALAARLRARS